MEPGNNYEFSYEMRNYPNPNYYEFVNNPSDYKNTYYTAPSPEDYKEDDYNQDKYKEMIEAKKKRWIYEDKRGKIISYLFSLEYPFIIISVPIFLVMLGIYMLIFVFSNSKDAIISFGLIYYFWLWGIWIFQLYILITKNYYRRGISTMSIPVFLYIVTVIQSGIIYSITRNRNFNAFVGMDENFSQISIFGLSIFLAIETIPGLGTGSIFPGLAQYNAFLGVGLNSLQGSALLILIFIHCYFSI